MGRFKTQQERSRKLEQRATDEEKEAEEMEFLKSLSGVPGWTGDHAKDALNPTIQNMVRRRHLRQKV